MSELITLARPYAKAAFKLALEREQILEWSQFLSIASSVINEPTVKQLLSNPTLKHEKIIEIIKDLGTGKLTSEQLNFLKTLNYYHRLILLPEIFGMFEQFRKELEKIIKVNIISAFAISEPQKKKFIKALTIRLQREVALEVEIDHSILGGAIIRAGDFVIDGSVKNQLERLKSALLV